MTERILLNTTPVGVNSLYSFHKGRKLLTKLGREKKEEIFWELKSKWKHPLITDEVEEIKLFFYFKDKRRRDVDGPIKFMLDAFSGIIYEDDSQVQAVYAKKAVDKNNPRVEVEVWYYGDRSRNHNVP